MYSLNPSRTHTSSPYIPPPQTPVPYQLRSVVYDGVNAWRLRPPSLPRWWPMAIGRERRTMCALVVCCQPVSRWECDRTAHRAACIASWLGRAPATACSSIPLLSTSGPVWHALRLGRYLVLPCMKHRRMLALTAHLKDSSTRQHQRLCAVCFCRVGWTTGSRVDTLTQTLVRPLRSERAMRHRVVSSTNDCTYAPRHCRTTLVQIYARSRSSHSSGLAEGPFVL